jgi:hypothetical protein
MTVTYNGLSAPPVEAGDYTVTVIFDEGAAYAATTLVLGVRTVMQVFNPPVLRKVTLHVSGDIISQPTRGEYHVNSGGNFTFTLTLPSDAMPTVSTTRRVNGAAEELTPTQNANGSYTYTAWLVYSDMEITVTSTVGNTAIAASKVWASGGKIHITATSAGVASVYNAAGHPVATRPYTAGETVAIPLPKGLYFILSEGRSYKVIVRE